MITVSERELISGIASLLAGPLAIWAWLLRRWIAKVDALHKDVATLEKHAAVRDERFTHLVGALDMLRKTIQDQSVNIGAITAAVEKMWIVLQAKGLVEARHSDDVLAIKRKP